MLYSEDVMFSEQDWTQFGKEIQSLIQSYQFQTEYGFQIERLVSEQSTVFQRVYSCK